MTSLNITTYTLVDSTNNIITYDFYDYMGNPLSKLPRFDSDLKYYNGVGYDISGYYIIPKYDISNNIIYENIYDISHNLYLMPTSDIYGLTVLDYPIMFIYDLSNNLILNNNPIYYLTNNEKIRNTFNIDYLEVNHTIDFGINDVGREVNAGKIIYGDFDSTALSIVGKGQYYNDDFLYGRHVHIFDNVSIECNLKLGTLQDSTNTFFPYIDMGSSNSSRTGYSGYIDYGHTISGNLNIYGYSDITKSTIRKVNIFDSLYTPSLSSNVITTNGISFSNSNVTNMKIVYGAWSLGTIPQNAAVILNRSFGYSFSTIPIVTASITGGIYGPACMVSFYVTTTSAVTSLYVYNTGNTQATLVTCNFIAIGGA
jgi:hypothetical protein